MNIRALNSRRPVAVCWCLAGLTRLAALSWLAALCWLPIAEAQTPLDNPIVEASEEPSANGEPSADEETSTSEEPSVAPAAPPTNSPQTGNQQRGNQVVTLQTTVTGNQEQPRVLYILPWQSPRASAADFEQLDSQQTPVFGHVERDELRRELEASGEFD